MLKDNNINDNLDLLLLICSIDSFILTILESHNQQIMHATSDLNSTETNSDDTSKQIGGSTSAATTSASGTKFKRIQTIENYVLVSIHDQVDEIENDIQNVFPELRKIVRTIKQFTDTEQCIKFMMNIKDEKIFLIVFDSIGQIIVPQIHQMPQVDAIFVFCRNEALHKEWTAKWTKIRCVSAS